MFTNNRVSFEKSANGDVRLIVRASLEPDAEVLIDETFSANVWGSIIATMSYYGEEEYGWYRAMNFHIGAPIHPSTPLNAAKLK